MIVLKQNYRLQDLLIDQAIRVEGNGNKIKSYAILCRAIEANKVLARSKNKIQKKGVCAETVEELAESCKHILHLNEVELDNFNPHHISMKTRNKRKAKRIHVSIKRWNLVDDENEPNQIKL